MLSRAQALSCGLTPGQIHRLIEGGTWIRALPSVYRVRGAPVSWHQSLMAAALWGDGRVAVCGRAAAALWELSGFRRPPAEICGTSNLSPPPGVVFHKVRRLAPPDVARCAGVRVTSVARTLLDLTPAISRRELERTLDEALRRHLVTLDAVRRCIERNGRRGRAGIAHLDALLAERRTEQTTDSGLESEVAAILREQGVPRAVKRHVVIEKDHRLAEVDLAWPAERVALQVHGSSIHRQPRTWENDQRVENILQLHGWLVIKVTSRMLRDQPEEIAELVTRALSGRLPAAARLQGQRRSALG